MARIDYYDDPAAPPANSLVPAASAVVVDDDGLVLLHRRRDNDLWALPGGVMELGESIAEAAVREVHEETGYVVSFRYVIGVYSDPRHVFAYDDGEVRQEFSVCIACHVIGGAARVSDDSAARPRSLDCFRTADLDGDNSPGITPEASPHRVGAAAAGAAAAA